MGKLKKIRKPRVDLDALMAEGKIKITQIDEIELSEMRGIVLEAMMKRPISEIAMKMAVDMKKKKPVSIRLSNLNIVLGIRRMLLYDLERIVKGGGLMPLCHQHDTELTFEYVKER